VTGAAVRREILGTWAVLLVALAAARLLSLVEPTGLLRGNLAGVAALLFVLLPDRSLRRRGETWADHGLPWWGLRDGRTWRAWGRGAAVALAACAILFPVFLGAFRGFVEILPRLPGWASGALAPYRAAAEPALRLPEGFALLAAVQLLVVALPEELFYRGWMQGRWAGAEPARGVVLLGARLGAGFLRTQALFALGHLAAGPQPWRLGTFFPGLLFGWLRARTGNVAAPVLAHALSNLFLRTLEASFYG
jgi:membrane protease YdiL (CAAX protease family)